jgi:ATP-binding cassette subfamily A (ABC1) protein 3
MGLKRYEKVKSGQLSGGNKRKLSVAMACIGNPPVVFLDEPSAGMDPEARKNMWRVINYIKSRDTSIILTTHSMDEAEALCERIAIMVAGRLRCLGSGSHIKNKFGNGYELFVKIKSISQADAAEIV